MAPLDLARLVEKACNVRSFFRSEALLLRERFRSRGNRALRVLFVASALVVLSASGCAGGGSFTRQGFSAAAAYRAMSANDIATHIAEGDDSEEARVALRSLGPQGLRAALAAFDAASSKSADASTLTRLSRAADTAGAQRDATVTRLYWYTDLEEAKRMASASGKPILSLRMLGHLDDDLSCANSRFFRTTLYPDREVNQRLANDFVLHWSSERPVPVVTIDYGDGRVIRRTITGNSIHYVLDPEGHVVDALPGLYSPAELVIELDAAHDLALRSWKAGQERTRLVADFQNAQLEMSRARWGTEARAVGFSGLPPVARNSGVNPSALMAVPVAPGKAAVEMPVVRAISFDLPGKTDLDRVPWSELADRLRPSVHLDERSRKAMHDKSPLDWSTGQPKPLDNAGFERLVSKFEEHVAQDMAHNAYFFHPQIRAWIAENPSVSLDDLNARVYSELFLTPASDPWLGLVPPIVYSGIQGDGLAPRSTEK